MIEQADDDLEPFAFHAAELFDFEPQGVLLGVVGALERFGKATGLGRDAVRHLPRGFLRLGRLLLDGVPLRGGGGDVARHHVGGQLVGAEPAGGHHRRGEHVRHPVEALVLVERPPGPHVERHEPIEITIEAGRRRGVGARQPEILDGEYQFSVGTDRSERRVIPDALRNQKRKERSARRLCLGTAARAQQFQQKLVFLAGSPGFELSPGLHFGRFEQILRDDPAPFAFLAACLVLAIAQAKKNRPLDELLRFSLRSLMIVVTLTALVLGITAALR